MSTIAVFGLEVKYTRMISDELDPLLEGDEVEEEEKVEGVEEEEEEEL